MVVHLVQVLISEGPDWDDEHVDSRNTVGTLSSGYISIDQPTVFSDDRIQSKYGLAR